MIAKEIMNKNVTTINADRPLVAAAKMMADENRESLPVEENGKLIGMITTRNITFEAVAKVKDTNFTLVRECMSVNVDCCRDTDDIDYVTERMMMTQSRHMPIINKHQRLVGFISVREIAERRKHNPFAPQAILRVCH